MLLGLSIYCTACKKWLEVNPKTQVSERVLFENEQGFKDALVGVYTQMGNRTLYGKDFTMGLMDVLSRNYFANARYASTYFEASKYNYTDAGTKNKIDSLWTTSYKAIANLNNLLAQVDQKKDLFTNNNFQIIKGEALALRAFLHFDLLRAFGPVPIGNMQTKAIPYVKAFNMDPKLKLSLQQVTDECLADLNQASALLAVDKGVYTGTGDVFRSFTRNHMNYWATTGLMARIYLYIDDKPKAYQKAKEVINAKLFPFITSSNISGTVPDRTFATEHLFGLYVANLQAINAELFKAAAGDAALLPSSNTFINNRFEISTGGSTDYRYLYLWKTDGPTATKYPVKYWSDDIAVPSNFPITKRIPLIRLSEMYYIAAEASTDLNESINLLNEVRTNRGLAALPQTLNAAGLETELFKEYKKEFYQEGQLFYYYKRKNRTQIEGYGPTVGPAVYVFPLPNDEIEFNPQ